MQMRPWQRRTSEKHSRCRPSYLGIHSPEPLFAVSQEWDKIPYTCPSHILAPCCAPPARGDGGLSPACAALEPPPPSLSLVVRPRQRGLCSPQMGLKQYGRNARRTTSESASVHCLTQLSQISKDAYGKCSRFTPKFAKHPAPSSPNRRHHIWNQRAFRRCSLLRHCRSLGG